MTQAGFGASSSTSPVYDSTITYTYDAANRLTQIADSANGTLACSPHGGGTLGP